MGIYREILFSAILHAVIIRNLWHRKMGIKNFAALCIIMILGLSPVIVLPSSQYCTYTSILSICIYGLLFQRDTRPQNICIGLLGEVLPILSDNAIGSVYALIFHRFARQDPYFWTVYLSIEALILFVVSYFCGKLIRYVLLRNKEVFEIRQIWYLADITLLLCSIIFAFNIVAGEKAGYPVRVQYFNFLLFLGYFLLMLFLLTSIFKAYHQKIQAEVRQKSFLELQNYTHNLEVMYNRLRSFKHDYINILTSLSAYIDNNNMEELKLFFNEKILPTKNLITQNDYKLNQLSNIGVLEIKSLLSAKMIYSHELGIDVTIDIPDYVSEFSIDTVDLARILGIFLDNAVEAAQKAESPKVGLNIILNPKSTAIIISNTFQNNDIPLHKLKEAGISTKTGHQGIGLSTAQEIINTYDNVLLETTKQDNYFTQYMEIATGKE